MAIEAYNQLYDRITPLEVKFYPDGMPRIEHNDLPTAGIDALLWRPRADEICDELLALRALLDALAWRGKPQPRLIIPSFPGARQDRLNFRGDYFFTLRTVADVLSDTPENSLELTVLDPHSDALGAILPAVKIVTAADCINPPKGKYAAIVSPDAGAEKRASLVAAKLGIPLIHAWKRRDVATGAITGFGIEQTTIANGSRVLVVDDICDGGGTFIGLAPHLANFDAHLWVTHGYFTKGMAELYKHYSHIYTTDSILNAPRGGVIEVKVCYQLLRWATL